MDTERPEEVKRIAIVGPECTGKTDLARFLANHYHTSWVPEFARNYIDQLNRPYEKDDLVKIADAQILLENRLALQANKLLICDTNLVVIKIWSEFKYGSCPDEIIEKMATQKYDLHLLTYIDIPWVDDPQREHPDKRPLLFDIYKNELVKSNVKFIEIKGLYDARRHAAVQAVEAILK
ncbi:MAG TPA: ATP-binding protein [Cyclobacteriaceae bacterium]